MRFAIRGGNVLLEVPHDVGLSFFEWIGLGRPEFGAIPPRTLAPLCRRRLWPMPRNDHPTLQPLAASMLAIAEAAMATGDAHVLFG
jgi:hypothetical protein